MARLEAGPLLLHPVGLASLRLARRLGALLAKADDLFPTIHLGLYNVRLGGMARRAARLVERQAILIDELGHFFLAARMLSTRFG